MSRKILAFIAALQPFAAANAAYVHSTGTVGLLRSFTVTGNGDVVFALTAQPATCTGGYWLRPTDGGFKSTLSVLLMAKAMATSITVYAYDTETWSGDITHYYCRVDSIDEV